MKRLELLALAPLLLGCSEGRLPSAEDVHAGAAVRQCNVQGQWRFGPVFGFGHGPGVGVWLRGLDADAFQEAATCLRNSLRGQGVAADIMNFDSREPGPPEIWIDQAGNRVAPPSRPPRRLPDWVWRDVNGRPVTGP